MTNKIRAIMTMSSSFLALLSASAIAQDIVQIEPAQAGQDAVAPLAVTSSESEVSPIIVTSASNTISSESVELGTVELLDNAQSEQNEGDSLNQDSLNNEDATVGSTEYSLEAPIKEGVENSLEMSDPALNDDATTPTTIGADDEAADEKDETADEDQLADTAQNSDAPEDTEEEIEIIFPLADADAVAAIKIEIERLMGSRPQGISKSEWDAIGAYYQAREFAPYFTTDAAANDALNRAISQAPKQGLPASRYELPINSQNPALTELYAAADFLRYSRDMERGLVEPRSISSELDITVSGRNSRELLSAFESSTDKTAFFDALEPTDPAYPALKNELANLQAVMGTDVQDPVVVPKGPSLVLGDKDPRVVLLRERLTQLGFEPAKPEITGASTVATGEAEAALLLDEITGAEPSVNPSADQSPADDLLVNDTASASPSLDETNGSVGVAQSDPQDFDPALDAAVREFQTAAGLTVDGIVGPGTLRALNQGPGDRLKSVLVAMERHRWASPSKNGREIYVNIANFMAEVRDNNEKVFETIVVVGKNDPKYRTPEFNDTMTHLIVNPKWNVPQSISVREYLPKIQRDPTYLARNNITMRIKGSGQVVSPTQIDMSQFTVDDFPFLLQQQEGDGNALGNVKFMFPNKHNIYLHDTPSKSLFGRSVRTFSHGCVRVRDPEDLATVLLSPQTQNPRQTYRNYISSGRERQVNLQTPIPVHLTYFTAYLNNQGTISYTSDSYGRDRMIAKALQNQGVEL